jgi:hypothetical protein
MERRDAARLGGHLMLDRRRGMDRVGNTVSEARRGPQRRTRDRPSLLDRHLDLEDGAPTTGGDLRGY